MNDKALTVIVARHRPYGPIGITGRSSLSLSGESVLSIIKRRLARCRSIGTVVLATTADAEDEPVSREAQALGLEVLRLEARSVLARLQEVCARLNPGLLVKVNGNYPLVDPEALDALVAFHRQGKFDFSFNEHVAGVPLGTGAFAFDPAVFARFDVSKLTEADQLKTDYFLLEHPEMFSIGKPRYADPRPQYRVCLDTDSDHVVVSEILNAHKDPSLKDIISFLDRSPVLARSNVGHVDRPEIGTEKILLFPEKVRAIQQASPVDQSYPVSVELSPTNRCNAQCVWCSDRKLRERQGSAEMSLRTILALLDDLRAGGTRGAVLEGGGEPTLHPGFPDIVKHAAAIGLKLGLITNGMDLRGVDPASFEWIRVSLDAASRETYRQLKGVDAFEAILRNLHAIAASGTILGVGYLVSKRNMDPADLEKLILTLRTMGASYIHFRPIIDHPELAPELDPTTAFAKFSGQGFDILSTAMQDNAVGGNRGLPCVAHPLSSVITANGDVFLCGRLNIHSWCRPLGSLQRQAFREIWLGDERRRQAEQVRDTGFCLDHCPQCRITKFNLLFHRLSEVGTRNFI